MEEKLHIPVMLNEMLHYLSPKDGEIYVDGTFGAGGYTKSILDAANCNVYAIDCDPFVVQNSAKIEQQYQDRFKLLQGKFGQMESLLAKANIKQVNGIVLDIGISSMQVDDGSRGFSFTHNGPLDMRMSSEGMTAADFVNNSSEEELANTIYSYGGEKKSRYIAKAILQAREKAPITTTAQFAEIVRGAIYGKKEKIDPATRTFQAIRILVNDELGELTRALGAAAKILAPQGRLVVVSFHSLEDTIIKEFFNQKTGKISGLSRHIPDLNHNKISPEFVAITRKVVVPGDAEINHNPRSRSAKLRAMVKV